MPSLSRSNEQTRHAGLARCLAAICCATLLVAGTSGIARAQVAAKEYQIKAAFLFNFVQFVEWPPQAFANAGTPITIGVLGTDPFGAVLDQTIEGETIHNRKLVVERSQRFEDLRHCQLLFVSRSEKANVEKILSTFGSAPVLTVSELGDFTNRGGNISFYLEGNKVRFEINPASAQQEGLKLSSQLLRLGRIVTTSAKK